MPPSLPLALMYRPHPPPTALQTPMDYRLGEIPRPQTLVPGLEQAPVEELEARLAAAALAEVKEKLAAFLAMTESVGVSSRGSGPWV